jgi:hypothetical protein
MGIREARDGEEKSFFFLGDLQSKTVSLRGGIFIFLPDKYNRRQGSNPACRECGV